MPKPWEPDLDRAADADGGTAPIATAALLFRNFGEHYHEQLLEEQHIFPLGRKAGGKGAGLIDTLLAQHRRGRATAPASPATS